MSAVVVGFISEKGGTGKTTACFHIAVALARFHEKRVLVIDVDYQRGGISGRFFPDIVERFGAETPDGVTMFHKFQELYSDGPRAPNVDIRRWEGAIDVMVADHRLATVTDDKLPATQNIMENNKSLLAHLQVIDYVIEAIRENYDYVLIDSHPDVSAVLRSVIYASDYCVSPVKLDRQSSIGVATVMGEINNVNADVSLVARSIEGGIPYSDTGFAGSMGMMAREWGGRLIDTESTEYNRLSRTGTGGVFKNYITEGDGLRRAVLGHCPVYDVNGSNAEKQSHQFRKLTKEFLKKCR